MFENDDAFGCEAAICFEEVTTQFGFDPMNAIGDDRWLDAKAFGDTPPRAIRSFDGFFQNIDSRLEVEYAHVAASDDTMTLRSLTDG